MKISPLIQEIAKTIFPIVKKHTDRNNDLVTFNISIFNTETERGEEYEVSVHDDVFIQTRRSDEHGKMLIVGVKGNLQVEFQCDADADQDKAFSEVINQLRNGVIVDDNVA